MTNGLDILYFGATDVGCVRTNNEDTLIAMQLWDLNHTLLVAIDGMGGEEGGEVAAEIARQTIVDFLSQHRDGNILALLKQALTLANNNIIAKAEENPRLHRMGCVATAGIFALDDATLYVAHVGDSRLYRYSQGELTKLTHDHSLVGYQEEQGILTEEQAMHHPRRSVIERCLGGEIHNADDRGFIDGAMFPLVGGESYIFCSDGLCDMLTSAQIADCLGKSASAEQKCLTLIEAAKDAGGKDNITVIVADISGSEPTNIVFDDETTVPKAADNADNADGTDNDSAKTNVDKKPKACPLSKSPKWANIALHIAAAAAIFAAGFFAGRCSTPEAEEIVVQKPEGKPGWMKTKKTVKDSIDVKDSITDKDTLNVATETKKQR